MPGQRRGRRDRLGIDLDVDDRRLAGLPRGAERSAEIGGVLDRRAEAAEGAGIGGEIGIPQLGRRHPAGIFALLVHADGAVHAVVADDHDDRQVVLHGGREFLAVHQEIAVAADRDDGAVRIQPLHRHRRRHAIAHRARGRRDMGAEAAEAVEAVDPGGVIAGAVAEDRVVGQVVAQPDHDLAEIDAAGLRRRLCRSRRDTRHARPGLGAPGQRGGRLSASAAAAQRPPGVAWIARCGR